MLVGLALALIAALSLGQSGPPQGHVPLTGFDPAIDMMPVHNNVESRSIEVLEKDRKPTAEGRCQGITDTNIAYYESRIKSNAPPMNVAAAAAQAKDPSIFKRVSETAQMFAIGKVTVSSRDQQNDSHEEANKIREAMRRTGMPQPIHLVSPSGNHSVLAYDAYEDEGDRFDKNRKPPRIIFKIADPNYPPGDPNCKTRELIYYKGTFGASTGGWAKYEGQYEGVHLRVKRPTDVYFKRNIESVFARGIILNPPPKPRDQIDDSGRAASITRDEVGGVLINFDNGLDPDPSLDSSWQDRALDFLNEEKPGTLLLGKVPTTTGLEEASLRRWLNSKSPSIGLTRVNGYRLDGTDVILLGRREKGMPEVDGDLLTVALAAIYREGMTPFVSLDPNPEDYYGPQMVRTGGIPDAFRTTTFMKVLLDADYDMKRIHLGELRLAIPGFRSMYELLQSESSGDSVTSRFWLTPLLRAAGDLAGDESGCVFRSDVQINTERIQEIGDYTLSPSPSSTHEEDAAGLMTRFYPQIERKVKSFYQLHGAFDVAKLAAILRHRGVKLPILNEAASRKVRVITIPASYEGIGPKVVAGTMFTVGGGAVAEIHAERLAIGTPGSRALGARENGRVLLEAAIRSYGANRMAECEKFCIAALRSVNSLHEARIYLALARTSQGRAAQAVGDLEPVIRAIPELQGLRGVFRLYAGDVDGANADVDGAAKRFPGLHEVWESNAFVKVYSLDFRGAAPALRRMFQAEGMSLSAHALQATAWMLSRMEPETARRFVERSLKLPLPLADALWGAYAGMMGGEIGSAQPHLERALSLAEQAESVRSTGFHSIERVLFMLTTQNAMSNPLAPSTKGSNPEALEKLRDWERSLERSRQDARSTIALWRARVQSKEDFEKSAEKLRHGVVQTETARLYAKPAWALAQRLEGMHETWPSSYAATAMCYAAACAENEQKARSSPKVGFDAESHFVDREEAKGHREAAAEFAARAREHLEYAMRANTSGDPLWSELEGYYGEDVGRLFLAMVYLQLSAMPEWLLEPSEARKIIIGGLTETGKPGVEIAKALLEAEAKLQSLQRDGNDEPVSPEKVSRTLVELLRLPAQAALKKGHGQTLAEWLLYVGLLEHYGVFAMRVDPGEAVRAATAIQNLPGDYPAPEAVGVLGMLRLTSLPILVGATIEQAAIDETLREIVFDAENGRFEAQRFEDACKTVADRTMANLKRSQSPFIYEMFQLFIHGFRWELELRLLSEMHDRSAGEEIKSEFGRLRDRVMSKQNALMASVPLSERISVLDPAIRSAATPADVKVLESFINLAFGPTRAMASAAGDVKAAARLQASYESARAKIRLRGMKLLREVRLPDKSYRKLTLRSLPMWTYYSAGGAVFVALAAVWLVKRNRGGRNPERAATAGLTRNFRIRSASAEDSSAAVEVVRAVYEEYGFTWDAGGYNRDLYDLDSFYLAKGHHFWVAESSDGIIGTCGLMLFDRFPGEFGNSVFYKGKWRAGGADCSLERLYVRPSARNKGVGSALLQTAIKAALREGRETMEIWSDKKLTLAHRMYERFGALQIGDRICDDPDKSPEWGMALQLNRTR